MYKIIITFDELSGQIVSSTMEKLGESIAPIIPAITPLKSQKPKTSNKRKTGKNEDIIILEENKLVLTQKLLDILGAEYGDRICIRFSEKDGIYYPIIAKSEVFADPEAGNKLTKSLTVSYKGKQHDELAIYGKEFTFEETGEGSRICRLIGKIIQADDKVFKSNVDLSPYEEDITESKQKDVEILPEPTRTYIPELKKSTDIGVSEEELNILGIELGEIDIPDDLDDLLNSL